MDTHSAALESHAASLENAVDMSHHLSTLAKERRSSPLKSFAKYMFDPTVRSLAGGLPNEAYFPFETLSATTMHPDIYAPMGIEPGKAKSWLASLLGKSLDFIEVPKYAKKQGGLQLKNGLQYGAASGFQILSDFLTEWTKLAVPPAYANWEVLLCDGSTDAFHKVVELLCEKGDGILVESSTYPSALETGWPMGVRPVTTPIDDYGLVPEALEALLKGWCDEERKMRRPRVLYTVPIGQNPTGSTINDERRAAVYALAVKYDFIIVEDDPYWALNFGPYGISPPGSEIEKDKSKSEEEKNKAFLGLIGKSYLKNDTQGRVIRIDTFSKTIAPGCRLGWTTSNPQFAERLLRASETSTQQPSGPVQLLVAELVVLNWGMGGWIRWLRGLRGEYGRRRNWMIDELVKGFDIKVPKLQAITSASTGEDQMMPVRLEAFVKQAPSITSTGDNAWNEKMAGLSIGSTKTSKGIKILSFIPPSAGMFCWVAIHLENHGSLRGRSDFSSVSYQEESKELMQKIWVSLADKKVLVAPGWMFSGDGLRTGAPDDDSLTSSSSKSNGDENVDPRVGHFRLAFATLEETPMRQTMIDFCKVVNKFFE
ncbi:Aromatic amino acid aminotransferase and related proteins [Phaffia rhodozyma]|uniref:Aromatic amino acid aminotransferase and related proteins n=1 Tax=Phaffia rhodozyma TaxID=264483 RepID=A0A0F7SMC3_PHARH|nr:Aromatic amino acid aminotransferase and related proteins [Phaffia rhodozyma]